MECKINLEQLKEEFNRNNIKLVEGTCVISENIPIIEVNKLDEYINVLLDLKALHIFYSLYYNDKDDYFIDKDCVLDEYGERVFNLIRDKAEEYNKSTEHLDFSIPYKLNLYFIKDNVAYLFNIKDNWLDDLEIFDRDVVLIELIDEIEPELEKMSMQYRKEIEDLGEELKELISNDEEFKYCTNQGLRGSYTRRLIDSSKFEKYKPYFQSNSGNFRALDVYDFVELLWKKLKAK